MRILQLIAMVRSMMNMIGIPIEQLLAIIQKVMSIGFPPSVTDEKAFREWLTKLAEVAGEVAAITPIVLDDAFAKFLKSTVADDAAWQTFYSIISMFFHSDGLLRDTPPLDAEVYAEADKLCTQVNGESLGLNPAMILAIIKLIVDIINAWKK